MPSIHLYTPCMFGCPHMFGHPPYVWMPPVPTKHKESMLCQTKGVSICPHTFVHPCMFGCPHMFGHPHIFVCPHMFGCSLYIHNTKHALSDLGGVHMPPIHLYTTLYVWIPHMFRYPQMYGGIQRHWGI